MIVSTNNTWLMLYRAWYWCASIFDFPQGGYEVVNTEMNSKSRARHYINSKPYAQSRLKKEKKARETMPGLWMSLIAYICLSYLYKCISFKKKKLKNWNLRWQLSSHCKWQEIKLRPRKFFFTPLKIKTLKSFSSVALSGEIHWLGDET